jgi:hypothetical protein
MSINDITPDPAVEFWIAIRDSDEDAMREIARAEPDLWRKLRDKKERIVCEAAKRSSPEAVRTLIDLGADIDEQDSNQYTGLSWAVAWDRYDIAKVLLECGANANLDTPIFQVANSQGIRDRIAMAKLLLDHGADINQPFLVTNLPPRTALSAAIENGHKELVEFLKSRGAKLPPAGGKSVRPQPAGPGDHTNDVVAHFRKHFGKPDRKVIQEIVPTTEHPVVVHHIPPSAQRPDRVLFTTGLSSADLKVPKGAEAYRRAELMVMLPDSWPAPPEAIKDPKWAWPIQWMRQIAAFVQDNNEWLGPGFTVLSEYDPPKPLAKGINFTAWLLVSPESDESVVKCKDGTIIHIYLMIPLYRDEYQFERAHGANKLLNRIVKHKVPEHIDVTRPSCVGSTSA